LRDSFKKMLWFYGFELHGEGDSVKVMPISPKPDLHELTYMF
jgi:hypothetical protein